MATIRQPADNEQGQNGIRARNVIATDRNEGKRAVFLRLPGAALRAVLVIFMIATPSLMLTGTAKELLSADFPVAVLFVYARETIFDPESAMVLMGQFAELKGITVAEGWKVPTFWKDIESKVIG